MNPYCGVQKKLSNCADFTSNSAKKKKKGGKVQFSRIIKILLMGKIKFHSPFIHVYASTSVAKKQ